MKKHLPKELYGEVVSGPSGYVMPETLARRIESTLPDLPEECRAMGYKRVAALPEGMEILEGERADISLITSDAIDRDREVMLPGGADWRDFRKNPVVTFVHHYEELPVGRSIWVRRVEEEGRNGWLAKTRYTAKPEGWGGTWFPDAVFHMVKEGDLRGKSIGFLPLAMSAPEEKEIEARPGLAGVQSIIRKWLALEYAVAPVQSNPEAYVVAVGKAAKNGLEIPMVILEEAGLCVPIELPGLKTLAIPELAIKRVIPYKDLGKAAEDTAWDGPKQVAAAAVDDLKLMCTWVDPDNADVKGGYKLPHHLAQGHNAVWRAVAAAMTALMGGRGGVAIPGGDKRGVYNHLAKHYRQFDKEPPDFRNLNLVDIRGIFDSVDVSGIVRDVIDRKCGKV